MFITGILHMFNKYRNKYGEYPCNDHLNNALRLLLEDEKPNANAIAEICYCVRKANGHYADDVARKLALTGLCPYKTK